jgi:glycosyltransferase involved in cell wall biosynthesis
LASNNIRFITEASDSDVARYMQNCRALIFPTEEDFGIVPLEVQACGKPVIAYGRGGALETVIPLKNKDKQPETGVFYYDQTPDALLRAVEEFEAKCDDIDPQSCRTNALRFDSSIFETRFARCVQTAAPGVIIRVQESAIHENIARKAGL